MILTDFFHRNRFVNRFNLTPRFKRLTRSYDMTQTVKLVSIATYSWTKYVRLHPNPFKNDALYFSHNSTDGTLRRQTRMSARKRLMMKMFDGSDRMIDLRSMTNSRTAFRMIPMASTSMNKNDTRRKICSGNVDTSKTTESVIE